MIKNFSLFLALRYLKPKRTFVSVITAISVIGVTLGVGVLLIVIAVMAGFEQKFKEQLLKFEPHIIVTPNPNTRPFFVDEGDDWDEDDGTWGDVVDDPENPFGDEPGPEEGSEDTPPDETPGQNDEPEGEEEADDIDEEDGGQNEDELFPEPAPVVDRGPAWQEIRERLDSLTGVVTQVSPFIESKVVLGSLDEANNEFNAACAMFGFDENDDAQIARLQSLITKGEFDISGENIILSQSLAYELHVGIGDEIQVYAPKMFDRILGIMRDVQSANAERAQEDIPGLEDFREHLANMDLSKPTQENRDAIVESFRLTQETLRKRGAATIEERIDTIDLDTFLTVTGIFESAQHEGFAFVPLQAAQRMYENFGDNVHGLQITTPDAFRVHEYDEVVRGNLPYTWSSITWARKWKHWFDIFEAERIMMFFVLVFIMIVAAFSIANTMIIVTVQKKREIGMMRALGARGAQIIGVFLWQGIIVGFLGTLCGVLFGTTVLYFRNEIRDFMGQSMGLEIFPASTFGIDSIPMRLDGMDVGLICIVAFILCATAAIPPAWAVARLDPAKALRNSS